MPGTSPGITEQGRLPSRSKKRLQHRRSLALANGRVHLRHMVAGGGGIEPHTGIDGAALGICRAVIEPADAGEGDGGRAHGAGLERDIEIAIDEPLAADLFRGGANGENFGMCSRVAVGERPVPGGRDHDAVPHDDAADRHLPGLFSRFGRFQGQIHERRCVHVSYLETKAAKRAAFSKGVDRFLRK